MTITKLSEVYARPDKRLTLNDVYDLFDKYNFIIHTKMGTFDTTDYNACQLRSDNVFGTPATSKILYLYKKSPVNAKIKTGTELGFDTRNIDGSQLNNTYTDVYIEKYAVIIDDFDHILGGGSKNTKEHTRMRTKILVKSERNFLENQESAQKVQ